ncbi:MAG TPA: 50S ribosomal protein L21 [Candidatus Limnocylindria bacterium]|nr:50S ribosomal protein L21 [Candidatus Limnocylindria bacterium]
MFAVVSSGGKQYRVEPGSTVAVDRVASEPGASITFDRVLLIGDGDETTVGTPLVSGASVSGTVLGEELGPKLVIFKFKQKVKYRRRTGHRQHMSLVRIDEITASGRTVKAEAAPKPEPKAATAEAKPKRATRAKAEEKVEPTAEAGPAAVAETSAPADEVKPKPRVSRARTAKPKTEASASTEETTEAAAKPKRRAPARTRKAETAEE